MELRSSSSVLRSRRGVAPFCVWGVAAASGVKTNGERGEKNDESVAYTFSRGVVCGFGAGLPRCCSGGCGGGLLAVFCGGGGVE